MEAFVTYKFSEKLKNEHYVQTAKRTSDVRFVVRDSMISAEAREAACRALVAWPSEKLLIDPPQDFDRVRTAADVRFEIELDAETLPDEARAVADVERLLLDAAEVRPAVEERIRLLEAGRKIEEAEKREKEIQNLLERSLDFWIVGKPGEKWIRDGVAFCTHLPTYVSALEESDPRLEARIAEARAEAERLNAEHEELQKKNRALVRDLIASKGTPNQLERYDADVLPEKEIGVLIRDELFAGFDFPKYESMRDSNVEHEEDCPTPDITFGSEAVVMSELTAEQWDRFTAIEKLVGDFGDVEIRQHVGRCRNCEARLERYGVRVTRAFAGEEYWREFALD